MRQMSGRAFARLVEQRGWQLLRIAETLLRHLAKLAEVEGELK